MARFIQPAGSGGSSDIADFVFTNEGEEDGSSIELSNKDMTIRTNRDDPEIDADINIYAADDIFIEAQGDDINISANNSLRLSSYNEEIQINAASYTIFNNSDVYLGSEDSENQVATLENIGIEISYDVQGGTAGNQPTFTGDPLFSASYIKMSSNLVHFQIQVDMDNITNFGTGQYYMTLPFNAAHAYDFREGCLHDQNTGDQYHISGHVNSGSNVLILFTTDVSGQNVRDFAFTSTEPITLATADNFHIAGIYICETS